ncbi:MAG: reactive intermediate/imine deaminase [Chromatiales bacterium]|jgi:reactive intermediate/imine deaminase|nr:reactive intermediate/imine deaminase [Chromatiales bacterium]MDP6149816.1 RidA family protein [Gammaproteobacteria bacterium]MDP7092992.1 RidA family protein [Gammaproteobacteria bacterium]MDP7271041.1 RidA family protein [Gammaproteobacteria bacterium]HJP04173.1 RidA family protein [Gammaproteobacteria bacterium]
MTKQAIHTDAAPAAIGPYSQAIRHNDTVYVSGQIPLDPATGELVDGGINTQVRQVFENLKAVAEASGSDLSRALKVTVFLTDLGHFGQVNEIMAEYFAEPYPARAAIEVSALPKGAEVEADAVLSV